VRAPYVQPHSRAAVGTSPSKPYQDGQAYHSFESCWSRLLAASEEKAQSHTTLASKLDEVAASVAKIEAVSWTALKRHHGYYLNKLLASRDAAESDRIRLKAKYDDACQALEQARQRKDTGKDEEKSERQFRRAESAMFVTASALRKLNCPTGNWPRIRTWSLSKPPTTQRSTTFSEICPRCIPCV
jgi:hypothetical protein